MNKKIYLFLNYKASALLLLVPYLNLIFVLWYFLIIRPKNLLTQVLPVLIGISVALFALNRLLPSDLTWLIPILVMFVISTLAYLYLRRNYQEDSKIHKLGFVFFGVLCLLALIVGLVSM